MAWIYTKNMKYLALVVLLISAMASCKIDNVAPLTAQTADTSSHHIGIIAASQVVGTSVTGTKLTMIYNENVNLLIPKTGYSQSWAVHLTEDFSASALSAFDYTTVDASGDVDFDWVDSNLNNIGPAKTITDTTINGRQYVDIHVQRPFTFSKSYTDAQLADNEQTTLSAKTTDVITFSSYIYFVGINYPQTQVSIPVTYRIQSNN
jgi:hypothetical protein